MDNSGEGRIHVMGGRVVADRDSIQGLRVEMLAEDRSELFDCAFTDDGGAFRLSIADDLLQRVFGGRPPRFFFRVFEGTTPLADTAGVVVWSPADGPADLRIEANGAVRDRDIAPTPYEVRGHLVDVEGRPSSGARVLAYDKNLRPAETLIGEATTDARGNFSIRYQPGDLGRPNKPKADLVLELAPSERVRDHLWGPRCQAPTLLILSLTLGTPREVSAYQRLMAAVAPALDGLALGELDQEQTAYLACSLGLQENRVAQLVAAHRLAPRLGVDPEVVWALLRGGLPSDLTALLERGRSNWLAAIERASREGEIAPRDDEAAAALAERLTSAAIEHIASSEEARFATLMRTATDASGRELVAEPARRAIVEVWMNHRGSREEMWAELERGEHAAAVGVMKRTLQLSAMTRDHLPLVAAVQKRFADGELQGLRDLARWDREDWESVIAGEAGGQRVGVPDGIEGDDEHARRTNYAEALTRDVETTFPTAFLAHRVAKDERLADEDFVAFFRDNPELEMRQTRLSDWLAKNPEALGRAKDPDKLEKRLRATERLLRLTTRQDVLRGLMANNVQSASELHGTGKKRFQKTLARTGATGFDAVTSVDVWKEVCWSSVAAQALVAKLHPNLRGPHVYAIHGDGDQSAVADYTSLFGSLATCACEHCRSELSPAAYLVDLLQFLDRYEAKEVKVAPTQKPGPFVEWAKGPASPVLSSVALQVEKAINLLPTIAIEKVGDASLSLGVWQTKSSEELVDVFDVDDDNKGPLQQSVSVVKQTLDDASLEVPLDLFGVQRQTARDVLLRRRSDIGHIKLTCSNTDTQLPYIDLVNEALEHRLVGNELPSPLNTSGTAEERALAPEIIDGVVHTSAYVNLAGRKFPWTLPFNLWETQTRAWLTHLGTSRAELMAALREDADSPLVQRAMRFDRLGIPLATADGLAEPNWWLLWGLKGESAPANWRDTLERVAELMQRAQVSYEQLVELLTAAHVRGGETLVIQSSDAHDLLTCDPSKLVVRRVAGKGTTTLTADILARLHRFERVRRILGWSVRELDRAIVVLGAPGQKLDGDFLEQLAVVEQLHTKIKRPIEELLAWWGPLDTPQAEQEAPSGYERVFLDPRLGIVDEALAWDSNAQALVNQGQAVADHQPVVLAALAISADDLRLLIDDAACQAALERSAPLPGASLDVATLSALYRYARCARALRLSVPDLLRLLALSGLDPFGTSGLDDAGRLLDLVERLRARNVTVRALDHLVRDTPNEERIDETQLKQLLADIEAELDGLLQEAVNPDSTDARPPVEVLQLRGIEAVVSRVAAALSLDERTVRTLATSVVRRGAPQATRPAIDIFVAHFDGETMATDEEERGATLRALEKAGLLASTLSLTPEELTRLEEVAGWLDDDGLPLPSPSEPAPPLPRFAGWTRIERFLATSNTLRGGRRTLMLVLGLAANLVNVDGTPKGPLDEEVDEPSFLAALAEQTRWTSADIAFLRQHFGLVHPASYVDGGGFVTLARAFEQQRLVGIAAKDALVLAEPEPSFDSWRSIATDARAAARAKHDTQSWASAARPIQDELRAAQRDALVAAILQDGTYASTTDLYDDLLLDVEMEPCRMTSRIKQAISATQLFIQRSFLNLEPRVTLDDDAAREWTWRKNYRVWEANRKVFLYPENWIQGRLRDDKTPLFRELEQELLQGELNEERAERAVANYVDGLEKLSQLQVMAVVVEPGIFVEKKLHVFARSVDRTIWHRVRSGQRHWGPWERVPIDVDGDLLIACVTPNRRLRVLWPQCTPGQYVGLKVKRPTELRLAWSELTSTGWTPMRSSFDEKIVTYPEDPAVRGRWFYDEAANGSFVLRLHFPEARFEAQQEPSEAIAKMVEDYLNSTNEGIGEPPANRWNGRYGGHFTFEHSGAPARGWPSKPTLGDATYFELGAGLTWQSGAQWTPPQSGLTLVTGDEPRRELVLHHHHHGSMRLVANPASEIVTERSFVLQDRRHAFVVTPRRRRVIDLQTFKTKELPLELRFELLEHPLASDLAAAVHTNGLDGIYATPSESGFEAEAFFEKDYGPDLQVVHPHMPVLDLDFSWLGASSIYNWELFFHIPFLIAERLKERRRFQEAASWLHRIFDPTSGSDAPGVARFWKPRPFYEAALPGFEASVDPLDAVGVDDRTAQIAAWEDDPFNPHLLARMRPVAYQKAVVMSYVDNLIAWGDHLFRQGTIEALNEATQLYILASKILGPQPTQIAPRDETHPSDGKSYNELEDALDRWSNALVDTEVSVPPRPGDWTCSGTPTALQKPYFCAPPNERLSQYWDTVNDRLFKIRHCMDIEGRVRSLPLFDPPIDPGILVRARAAGVDIGAALADILSARPLLRFQAMVQRARELVSDVRQLGTSLLSALEKRDGEQLAQLRQTHEQAMLKQVREERKLAIDEARQALAGLEKARDQAVLRWAFNASRERWMAEEELAARATDEAGELDIIAGAQHGVAAIFRPMIQIFLGTLSGTEAGGAQLAGMVEASAHAASAYSSWKKQAATEHERTTMRRRREEDWDHATAVAAEEIAQLDKQIAGAELRIAIAERQLESHDLSAKHSREIGDFLRTKFTDDELYDWMIGELSAVYFQLYELAYDAARKAEAAFRFELGIEESDYISFGYWNDLHKGLMAGDKLGLDLRRLEMAHAERDRRELELSRSISLVLHAPLELMTLKETGKCEVRLPESFFDADYPGHYFRRVRNVALTIACVAGPHTPINCRLTLEEDRTRVNTSLSTSSGNQYAKDGDDSRFRDNRVPNAAIATTSARNDTGMFEVSFSGPRYLPFEGAGAESRWTIDLPKEDNGFDFDTITDVVLRLDYTARDGGDTLRGAARDALKASREKATALQRLVSLRHEMPDAWENLVGLGESKATGVLTVELTADHFPYLLRGQHAQLRADRMRLIVDRPDGVGHPASVEVTLQAPQAASPKMVVLSPAADLPAGGAAEWPASPSNDPPPAVGVWQVTVDEGDLQHFTRANLRDLWLLVDYHVAPQS